MHLMPMYWAGRRGGARYSWWHERGKIDNAEGSEHGGVFHAGVRCEGF